MLPKTYFVQSFTLKEILKYDHPTPLPMAIAGYVDFDSSTVNIWLCNKKSLTVPFSEFSVQEGSISPLPNFNDFSIIDYGQTIKLGQYEAAVDALFPEFLSEN